MKILETIGYWVESAFIWYFRLVEHIYSIIVIKIASTKIGFKLICSFDSLGADDAVALVVMAIALIAIIMILI